MGTPELTQLMDSNESWLKRRPAGECSAAAAATQPPHLAAKRARELVRVMHMYSFLCVPRGHQSQHYRSQVRRRLAHRIFRYNGAKISVKRELRFFVCPLQYNIIYVLAEFSPRANIWNSLENANCARICVRAERFHEWQWAKFYGAGP